MAGVAFGVATIPILVYVGAAFGYHSRYTISIPLSAMLTGGVVWFLVVEWRESHRLLSGAIVGAATGLLSFFVYWPLTALWEPQFFFESLPASPVIAILSILWFGLFSVPLGIIAGVFVGALRKPSE